MLYPEGAELPGANPKERTGRLSRIDFRDRSAMVCGACAQPAGEGARALPAAIRDRVLPAADGEEDAAQWPDDRVVPAAVRRLRVLQGDDGRQRPRGAQPPDCEPARAERS